jgi:hypothetical protein
MATPGKNSTKWHPTQRAGVQGVIVALLAAFDGMARTGLQKGNLKL